MTKFFLNKTALAASVNDHISSFEQGSVLIMTIRQGPSEGFFALTVTDESSEDTDLLTAKFFSDTQVNT